MELPVATDRRATLGTLRRLRDVSQLILVAIEHDDTVEIERLANESERLIDTVRPAFEGTGAEAASTDLIDEIAAMNRMIVRRLQERRAEVAAELCAASQLRTQLRAIRGDGPCEGDELDRET